jgi:hypothetical protein
MAAPKRKSKAKPKTFKRKRTESEVEEPEERAGPSDAFDGIAFGEAGDEDEELDSDLADTDGEDAAAVQVSPSLRP